MLTVLDRVRWKGLSEAAMCTYECLGKQASIEEFQNSRFIF